MNRPRSAAARLTPEGVLGWALTAAAVLLGYLFVVRGGALLLGAEQAPIALSIAATVLVATLIDPVQTRGERLARRVLHREREAPYDVLARFSSRVAEAEVAGELPHLMARLLAEGTQASWAQVWVRVNGRLTLMATHPVGAPTDAPPDGPGVRSVAVGHDGAALGVLRVQERPDHPLTPVEERLFAGLAAQAGLALHTAQLRAELVARHAQLAQRAAELTDVRNRLVAAQDQERQRLERDIHDGAQQQLVALRINLGLAQTLADRVPERAAELLQEQAGAAASVIATVETLSRGDAPAVLRRDGLVAAVRDAASSCPLPVDLALTDVGRLAAAVESTAYFVCLEAMQNVVKHAEATRVSVSLGVHGTELLLEVRDDGIGELPRNGDGTSEGRGLRNMEDRLVSVGGTLQLALTVPGHLVRAVLPMVPAVAGPTEVGR